MQVPDPRIVRFIRKHHVMHLATCANGAPHAASLFYYFDAGQMQLVFASSPDTAHITQALAQNQVAGTIANNTFLVPRIKGVQFEGRLFQVTDENLKNQYLLRFPAALLISYTLWSVMLDSIKMTDNSFGFGVKVFWGR